MNDIKSNLSPNFKIRDLGQLSYFLGIEFEFDKSIIRMSQTKYLQRILNRFGMANCNPKARPCNLNINMGNNTGWNDKIVALEKTT